MIYCQPDATQISGIPEQDNSGCTGASGYSEYVTAPSYFDETATTHPRACTDEPQILQAVDRGSGAVFERVCLGTQGEVDAQYASSIINVNAHTNDLSYHVVPRDWLAVTGSLRETKQCAFGRHGPSLILTVPTPVMPQSPVFVPQSPITVSKFFSAAATAHGTPFVEQPNPNQPDENQLSLLSPSQVLAPSLTSCGQCGLSEFDLGMQCRACNERWLACKVWYRANDGGRRQWLTEPYIRPGECNEKNRAMMRGLGVVGCDRSSSVADTTGNNAASRGSGTKATIPRERLTRAWRSLSSHAVRLRNRIRFTVGSKYVQAFAKQHDEINFNRLRSRTRGIVNQARSAVYSMRDSIPQRLVKTKAITTSKMRWRFRDLKQKPSGTEQQSLSASTLTSGLQPPMLENDRCQLGRCPHCGEDLLRTLAVSSQDRANLEEQFDTQVSLT